MAHRDFEVICSKINEEKEFLNGVSQEIWKSPELLFKEVHAHALLTCALKRHGFQVQKHYFMPTAFRGEYFSKSGKGTTVAFLLEYDALPDIGHACGHNLIAEAGLAAAIGAKAALEEDASVKGKIVVIGTPAEEGGAGKVKLLELGAFDDIDVALMVHPASTTQLRPFFLNCINGSAFFKGKEAHAAAIPWNGINALDAAVACYQSIAQLRQQIKPTSRINAIITKGGTAVNVIPADTSMDFLIRTATTGEMKNLLSRVEACINGAAKATACTVKYSFSEEDSYQNLLTNEVLIEIFKAYLEKLDFNAIGLQSTTGNPVGSTDMGNVSHKMPSIHPLYAIPSQDINHTKGFTESAGAQSAQEPTLAMGKALALTALHVMRSQDLLEAAKNSFDTDLKNDAFC